MLNNVHFSEDEEDLSYHVETLFTNRLSVKAGMRNWRMRGMIGMRGIKVGMMRMQRIRMGMLGIKMVMRGIGVGMRGSRGRTFV